MNRVVPSLVVLLLAAPVAHAQQQTVQLPTFNFTTVNTTVSVPDGGTGLLGGISRLSEGCNERGVPLLSNIPYLNRLFTNRGIGREVSKSNMTVVPRIIIQEEEEFLQTGMTPETVARRDGTPAVGAGLANVADPALAKKANFLASNVARHTVTTRSDYPTKKLPSVEEIRKRNEAAKADRLAEARELFQRGQRAESEGKPGVAKVYYQMAGLRADGDLQSQILARLAGLPEPAKGQKLAGK
jgi:type II secretory pathway component GspD/PulD (secretin)